MANRKKLEKKTFDRLKPNYRVYFGVMVAFSVVLFLVGVLSAFSLGSEGENGEFKANPLAIMGLLVGLSGSGLLGYYAYDIATDPKNAMTCNVNFWTETTCVPFPAVTADNEGALVRGISLCEAQTRAEYDGYSGFYSRSNAAISGTVDVFYIEGGTRSVAVSTVAGTPSTSKLHTIRTGDDKVTVSGGGCSASTSPSPSPSGTTTTLAGETFDPTGYTVGTGWIWNRYTLGGNTDGSWCDTSACKTQTSNAAACRQSCVDDTNCVHFARRESDGACYKFGVTPTTAGASNGVHIRGFKKDGNGNFTAPVNIGSSFYDSATLPGGKQEMTIQNCVSRCDGDSNCVAFFYRTTAWNNGSTPNWGNKTCSLHGRTPSTQPSATELYREGAVGR